MLNCTQNIYKDRGTELTKQELTEREKIKNIKQRYHKKCHKKLIISSFHQNLGSSDLQCS